MERNLRIWNGRYPSRDPSTIQYGEVEGVIEEGTRIEPIKANLEYTDKDKFLKRESYLSLGIDLVVGHVSRNLVEETEKNLDLWTRHLIEPFFGILFVWTRQYGAGIAWRTAFPYRVNVSNNPIHTRIRGKYLGEVYNLPIFSTDSDQDIVIRLQTYDGLRTIPDKYLPLLSEIASWELQVFKDREVQPFYADWCGEKGWEEREQELRCAIKMMSLRTSQEDRRDSDLIEFPQPTTNIAMRDYTSPVIKVPRTFIIPGSL